MDQGVTLGQLPIYQFVEGVTPEFFPIQSALVVLGLHFLIYDHVIGSQLH